MIEVISFFLYKREPTGLPVLVRVTLHSIRLTSDPPSQAIKSRMDLNTILKLFAKRMIVNNVMQG